ncbi:hypothetical protein [Caballeronia sp. dw_276]|uniref:hypothetical protein n=1 Tax=Caballeronia sp. dw_276 TaxID=2719795 RepID=UPI001BD2A36D|nr:hypothetical protein [Caballeronia sp. dw_276]
MTEKKTFAREPIPGGLVISKADAAERQLKTAIWLWFHNFDPVPIHALACAALKILWKLHQKHGTGYQTMRDRVIERVQPEHQKSFIEVLNETENFIKHADRDPMAFHTFNPRATDFVLMDAVAALQALSGVLPMESRAYMAWFFLHNPSLITRNDNQYQRLIESAREIKIDNVGREDFYRMVCEGFIVNQRRQASEHSAMEKRLE